MNDNKSLQTIWTICLSVNHIDNLLLHFFSLCVPACPVVAGPAALFGYEYVLRVVQLRICAILNSINNPRLEINQQRSWYIMIVVCLVEEYIFPILDLIAHRIFFEYPRWAYAMLLAQLLPKLTADYDNDRNYSGCRTGQFEVW